MVGEKRCGEWAHGLVRNGWGDNSEVLEPRSNASLSRAERGWENSSTTLVINELDDQQMNLVMHVKQQATEAYTVADGRFKRSGSGSDPFRTGSQNPVGSGPRTGPLVRFFPSPEPWTEPRSGSAGFRFEPRF